MSSKKNSKAILADSRSKADLHKPHTPHKPINPRKRLLLTPSTPTTVDVQNQNDTAEIPQEFKSSILATPLSIRRTSAKSTNSLADTAVNWRTPNRSASSVTSLSQDHLPAPFASIPRRGNTNVSKSLSTPFKTPPPKVSRVGRDASFIKPKSHELKSPFPTSRMKNLDGHGSKTSFGQFSAFSTAMERREAKLQITGTDLSTDALMDVPNLQKPTSCSGCGLIPTASSRLAILHPCSHLVCPSCLTGSLNVVGEKDMICMGCRRPIQNFSLNMLSLLSPTTAQSKIDRIDHPTIPKPRQDILGRHQKTLEYTVLRLDNVPWDITPAAIESWLEFTPAAIHVLIDRKDGKTLSHAFIEASLNTARDALRRRQNSILGRGKRARAVTITMSSQEELMKELFPSWEGGFRGSQPIVAMNQRRNAVLLSYTELTSLLHLIRTPNSHFLKVPSLPFHVLISLISKFPSQSDGCILWSNDLRDALFAVTLATIDILASRSDEVDFDEPLFSKLVWQALKCPAFTPRQLDQISLFIEVSCSATESSADSSSLLEQDSPSQHSSPFINTSPVLDPSPDSDNAAYSPYHLVAREFGIQPGLVHALAQRLSSLH